MLCEPCEYLRDNGALSRFFGVKRDNGSSDLSSENTVDLVEVEVINDFIVVVVLGFFFDPKVIFYSSLFMALSKYNSRSSSKLSSSPLALLNYASYTLSR